MADGACFGKQLHKNSRQMKTKANNVNRSSERDTDEYAEARVVLNGFQGIMYTKLLKYIFY